MSFSGQHQHPALRRPLQIVGDVFRHRLIPGELHVQESLELSITDRVHLEHLAKCRFVGLVAVIVVTRQLCPQLVEQTALADPGFTLDQHQPRTTAADGLLEAAQAAHQLDPLAPVVNASLAWAYLYNFDFEQAERFAKTSLELGMGGTWAEDVLGLVYIYAHEYDKALEVFSRDHPDFALNRLVVEAIADPAKVPEAVAAIETVDYFRISYWPTELMLLVGETDRALDLARSQVISGDADVRALWRPHFIAQAADARYASIVSLLELPAYWDATTWPTVCRRAGQDFTCDPAFVND